MLVPSTEEVTVELGATLGPGSHAPRAGGCRLSILCQGKKCFWARPPRQTKQGERPGILSPRASLAQHSLSLPGGFTLRDCPRDCPRSVRTAPGLHHWGHPTFPHFLALRRTRPQPSLSHQRWSLASQILISQILQKPGDKSKQKGAGKAPYPLTDI